MKPLAPGRIPCEVPFCRRTARADKYEPGVRIICGKHWRLADRSLRRRWSRLKRLLKRGVTSRVEQRLIYLCNRLWERALKQAIERAMGVTG